MADSRGDEVSIKDLWADAEAEFQKLTGKYLRNGPLKSFEDVQASIESRNRITYGGEAGTGKEDKWDKEKFKDAGLKVLKCLKMLVGAATQLSSDLPVPSGAANLCANAIIMVLDIPNSIREFNDAVSEVFTKVSSVLSQFRIYERLDKVDNLLARQIHLVMMSFVKICAHVVSYQQGSHWERLVKQTKASLSDDSGLGAELTKFETLVQQQRDVEGTIVLEEVITSRKAVFEVLEKATETGQRVEDIHGKVGRLDEDLTERREENDKVKRLIKIRDTLGVPAIVRLDSNTTQTCTNYYDKCLDGTGAWVWEHPLYQAWTSPANRNISPVLLLSGGSSSGKTYTTAMITKRLENQKATRTYVAHYFFPPSSRKSEDEKYPVQTALKYMAFQIARVDATVSNALGKVCEVRGPIGFRSLVDLKALWAELKIGSPGLGATYYLVFDGLEHLPAKHSNALLEFAASFKPSSDASGSRVRVLISGTEKAFDCPGTDDALQINISEHSIPDMERIINNELNTRGMLQHAKPGSKQEQARQLIREQLPQTVNGSYSLLQLSLDNIIRRLDAGAGLKELQEILKTSMSSYEAAIQNLQRSLAPNEIKDLNELLRWVIWGNESLTLGQLEAAMYLYSDTESLAMLDYIIKNKYSTVLKLEDGYVLVQDHMEEVLTKERANPHKPSSSEEGPTISMSITIKNVDQELCQHFLWDLAQRGIRDKFRFDFDAATNRIHSSQDTIEAEEFQAHHSIVQRALKYLDSEPSEQATAIGPYLISSFPFHLKRLRVLESEDKGELTPLEKRDIADGLYNLFRSDAILRAHKESIDRPDSYWSPAEIREIAEWFTDSTAVKRIDKRWLAEIRSAETLTRGFLRPLVQLVLDQFLRDRTWGALSGYRWVEQFVSVDEKKRERGDDASESSDSRNEPQVDWQRISDWCQDYLDLQDDQLDSLWYERLAEAAAEQGSSRTPVLEFYEKALSLPDPSWRSYRGLGTVQARKHRVKEAIESVKKALECAEAPGSSPQPKPTDLVELHLQLGDYYSKEDILDSAADHYSKACLSEDADLARKGQVGRLKVSLRFLKAEAARQLLRDTLHFDGGEARFVSILKTLARDEGHDEAITRLFAVARADRSLLGDIVRCMEIATALPNNREGQSNADEESDERYEADECRGVLLYDRALAAYAYNITTDGSEPIVEALKLWKQCREQLVQVGGPKAFFTRKQATTALSKYYFQSMTEGKHLDSLVDLEQFAEADSNAINSMPAGYLAALHVGRGDHERALKALSRGVKLGLQVLSDDNEENDFLGFGNIEDALVLIGDLRNAAIGLSFMGRADRVTEALRFQAEPVATLARQISQAARSQIPDTSHQLERIQAAKEHVKALLESPGDADESTMEAYAEIQSKLDTVQAADTSEQRHLRDRWWCDGTKADGRYCFQQWDTQNELYQCLYCADTVFCRNCLARLRNNENGDDADIFICSAKHKWLKIPCTGSDMYVGLRADSAPVATAVEPVEGGDEQILEIRYEDDEQISLDAWKDKVAETWGFSLADVAKEVQEAASDA